MPRAFRETTPVWAEALDCGRRRRSNAGGPSTNARRLPFKRTRRYLDAVATDALFAPRHGGGGEADVDGDAAAGALAAHLDATLQAASRFCALVDAFVSDAVAGDDARAAALAARLTDATSHFDAAAARFKAVLRAAADELPEATKLAFRLRVEGVGDGY